MRKRSSNKPIDIRAKLIENGVKNLHEYGYQSCDKENILTDIIYSGFFRSMLNDNYGQVAVVDPYITQLLSDVTKVKIIHEY